MAFAPFRLVHLVWVHSLTAELTKAYPGFVLHFACLRVFVRALGV